MCVVSFGLYGVDVLQSGTCDLRCVQALGQVRWISGWVPGVS